jgi:hypothetical protein
MSYVESGWGFLNNDPGSSSGDTGGNGSGSGDGGGGVMDLSWAQSTPELEADIAASTFSQPTETFSGTGGGPEWSDTNPYFTSPYGLPDALWGSNVVSEHKPITNPSDMMIGNLLAYELSKDPKYGPGEKGEFVGPGSPPTNTLGKIMAVDSKGQMILDSSGNPIFTGFGKQMVDEFQANWDPSNPMDITLPGVFKEMAGDVIGKEKEYFKDIGSSTQGGGGYGYGYGGGGGGSGGGGGYYGDPRTGNPIDRYGNFYTPQANLQQAMVNVHGTPTVFKKRGGIVSLLGLGS